MTCTPGSWWQRPCNLCATVARNATKSPTLGHELGQAGSSSGTRNRVDQGVFRLLPLERYVPE
jgi:hypothetical protein